MVFAMEISAAKTDDEAAWSSGCHGNQTSR